MIGSGARSAARRTVPLPRSLRLLLLGGTTEGHRLADALAGRADIETTVSLAGRTAAPLPLPLPTRMGGFGGADGLAAYLRTERIEAVVDATHPFALRISDNARRACAAAGVPLAAYTRPPWTPRTGDRWTAVDDLDAAAAALGAVPRRVFLTTGRLGLAAFRAAPWHDYLLRSVEAPDPADMPPQARVVLARGPFALAEETTLLRRARIEVLVTKNSGGTGSAAKLAAARALGLPVVMVEPPRRTEASAFVALDAVLGWIEARHRETP